MNAPWVFQRTTDLILIGLDFVRVYLDDVIIVSKFKKEGLEHLRVFQERIAPHNLKVKILKCAFAQSGVSLLGHIVD